MTVDTTVEQVEVHTLRKPKVGIVGFAEGHLNEAPYGNADWELWGINRLHVNPFAKEQVWDRWFNLHDLEEMHGEDEEHLEWLKEFPGPVYLRPQDVGKYEISNQVAFPIDDVVKAFGTRYYNNTISYLLAYSIMLEPTEIGVYGVDMAQDSVVGNPEYAAQRPSCEYFLGVAAGRGISLTLPKGSDLLKTSHMYGFEDPGVWVSKMLNRLQEVGGRKEQVKQEMAELDAELNRLGGRKQELFAAVNQLDGAMQDTQYYLRNWRPQDMGEPVESPNGKVT